MMEPQALAHGVCMRFNDLDAAFFVRADRIRLKQVMINLLMNAIKYNRPGGSVSVDIIPRNGSHLGIHVRDTGLGMTNSQLAQLFQPFNRLGKESSAEEGTGIGLVVTKRLTELMGGSVGVESRVGVGSDFWIDLRLACAPAQGAVDLATPLLQVPAVEHQPSCYSVLYVEDIPANLDLVEQIISRRADVHFFSAAEAGIGIALARSHMPDVILMDINLPGISGMDAMQILRSDPRTAHIPILALSANAAPRDIQHAIKAGFFDYITKPIHVIKFLQALDVALVLSQKSRKVITLREVTA